MEQNNFSSNIISVSDNGNSNSTKINYVEVKKGAAILRSINHKLRQSIIKLLEEKDKLTVTEIYVKLRVEQSVASQHLAILRRAEFVQTSREGKNIHYSLNQARLDEVNTFIKQLLKNDNE
ncbi:MAG TPA: metalloregulator ArsR/SmtB family transcription factor [Chitinophagaceae bacterium]|jgi:DNA-binding transcriptional ArsR family regulator|nr:metalloregulator ArsR/SmtB family transcription factor [Chitinophagaceae bacterium]